MSLNGHLSRPAVTSRFKRPTRGRRAALCPLFGLASDGVYMCPACYQTGGSLLHCPSTLTAVTRSGIFLLHFPWSRLHQTLSGILPCEARTFLICGLSAPAAAAICLTQNVSSLSYFFSFVHKKYLRPAVICVNDSFIHGSSFRR